MRPQRIIISILALAIILFLLVRQAGQWARFDWAVFWAGLHQVRVLPVLAGVALCYFTYPLRALRWSLLMGTGRPAPMTLLRPTIIGSASVALLGRPAEFVRPYLIAQQEKRSLPSQLAIWTAERIFDAAAFASLLAVGLFVAPELETLPYVGPLRRIGMYVLAAVLVLGLFVFLASRKQAMRSRALSSSSKLMHSVYRMIVALGEGLEALGNFGTFFQVSILSLVVWILITLCFLSVVRAFPGPLATMRIPSVLLLMAFTLAGSLLQLPGSGAQPLIMIAALSNVFSVPAELAVSCGILLWLAAYMAPAPAGLALLRSKHLSLRRLSKESFSSGDGNTLR